MIRCYRAVSVSVRGFPGRPKIRLRMYTGPIRFDQQRVENLRRWMSSAFPSNENVLQVIEAKEGILDDSALS